jgi:gliding motility-associated-like protein
MKISPDGSKLALVIPDDGIVDVYDFDNSTGKVSNRISSTDGQFEHVNGIEFSPDNSKLYFTITALDNGTNFLYQVNLNDADPFGSPFPVQQFDYQENGPADSLIGAIQLAVDGKIYVAKFKRGVNELPYLGVVYNPNRPMDACNYNELNHSSNNGLYLNGGNSLIGLPNFASNFLDIPHFYYANQCHKDTTSITIRNTANIDPAEWDFGNPGGTSVGNDDLSPRFIYSDPGDYTISLTENYEGEQYTYTKDIKIHELPNVTLAQGVDTVYILENSSVQLDAGQWDFYEWTPGGSTERYLDVTQDGWYKVMVTDSNCCRNVDSVFIEYATISFPNAFNPKSNITTNSVFKIVGEFGGFKSYRLSIFNRWGQLLFDSEDPTEGWDGTYNGQESPAGTYVYSAYFESFESDLKPSLVVKKSGTITLLR